MAKKVLYWFRATDLRLHDSPALKKALDLNPEVLYPVFTWDPHYVYTARVGPNRWQFLTDSMRDLSKNITAINPASKLFVVRGSPTTLLPALWKEWGITDIVWERDDDKYTTPRDAEIERIAAAAGVEVHIVLGHVLYDHTAVHKKNKGASPASYGPFLKILASLPKPPKPIDAPASLPSPGPTDIASLTRALHPIPASANDTNEASRTDAEKTFDSISGPNGDFAVPTLEELGMTATTTIRGGETRALEVFEEFMKDKQRVATFEKPKTAPGLFDPPSTTQLSPHLKFGTLSCRTFYHRVMDINAKFPGASSPPESLIGQLLWREFFHSIAQSTGPVFGQIRGNKVSRFIEWGLQTRYDAAGNQLEKSAMEKIWQEEEPQNWEYLQAWKQGRTGFPWIDALMRQLKAEGWMHHLGRHSTACMLTRGQLYISWERGMDVYEELLVDHDHSVNAGNWMWLSASAFFVQYFRVYSPATYGQNTEKKGLLIRKYCPELKGLSDKYIYEPWKASAADLKKAGVVLGGNYPKRIVDDKVAKAENLTKIKAAYGAKMMGNDPKVLANTAAAYVETFLPSGDVKTESSAKEQLDADEGSSGEDEDTKKPKTGAGAKRKAPVKVAVKAAKGAKQTTLSFAKSEE